MFFEDCLEVYDDIELGQRLRIVQTLGIRRATKLFSDKKQDCEADTIRLSCCSIFMLVRFRLIARHWSRAKCLW